MKDNQVTQTGDQGAAEGQTEASQSLGWRAALPDEFKEHEYVKGFSKPGDFVKSALDLKTENDTLKTRLDGAIIRPGDDATDEQRAAFMAAMGVPETPDKYEFDRPEGVEINEAMETWFRNIAHKRGMPGDMAKGLYEDYNQFSLEFMKALQVERTKILEKDMNTLKETWGNKFDERVTTVQKVQEKIGAVNEPFKKWLADHNADNDPILIQFLYDLAPGYLDDRAPAGRPPGGGSKVKEGMQYKVPNPPQI